MLKVNTVSPERIMTSKTSRENSLPLLLSLIGFPIPNQVEKENHLQMHHLPL